MKKGLSLLLSVIFMLSVVGCGKTAPSDSEASALFEESSNIILSYLGEADDAAREAFDGYESFIGEENLISSDNKMYFRTNCKYKDASDKYSKIFSGALFEDFMNCFFYDNNGVMYIRQNGRTGASVGNVSVCLDKEDGDKYYYTVSCDRYEGTDDGEPVEGKFVIERTSDGLRICETDIFSAE